MDISAKIKSIRESRGILQKEIANSLKIEQSNYSRFEQRGSKMSIEQLESICSVLGITLGDFFKNENENDLIIKETKKDLLKIIDEKTKEVEYYKETWKRNFVYNSSLLEDIEVILVNCSRVFQNKKMTDVEIDQLKKLIADAKELVTSGGFSRYDIETKFNEFIMKPKSKKTTK